MFEKLQRKLSSSKRLVRSRVHWRRAGFVARRPICARLFLIARRPELASSKSIPLTLICFAWECSFASLSVQDVPKSRIRPAWNCRNGLGPRSTELNEERKRIAAELMAEPPLRIAGGA